jgi:hypothetical protein
VVRFAETNGFETNTPRPNAWPYRDYVIESFNQDKPYNRFILEQLAGDQVGEIRGTGFLVGGPYDTVKSPDLGLTLAQRMNELDDMLGTTSTAFLGLTVACARCHDHKFDPISQTDYYRFQAVFAGVQHGEAPYPPPDQEEKKARAEDLKKDLSPLLAELARYEPLADRSLILIDDEARLTSSSRQSSLFAPLIEPNPDIKAYSEGEARGQLSDPGTGDRVQNLGRRYTHWSQGKLAGKDLAAWSPGVTGSHQVWVSWGAGWPTRATDASFHLDRDGDLETVEDRDCLTQVDQRHFAEGEEAPFGAPLWSGLHSLGVLDLTPSSRILFRAGSTDASVSADLMVLKRIGEEDEREAIPAQWEIRPRPMVVPEWNTDRFDPIPANALRFEILGTNQAEPCIDELEVFTPGEQPINVAAASRGAQASSSGDYPGGEIHRLPNIHDGKYGNSHSWISNQVGGGWVRIDFSQVETIDRVTWARDREGKYRDRLATDYRIQVRTVEGEWVTVSTSLDRLPFQENPVDLESLSTAGLAQEEKARLEEILGKAEEIESRIADLESVPRIYAGQFVAPGTTARLHRGDALQPREVVTPGAISGIGPELNLKADTPEAERRLALARWIASPENPLTARVMVNRVWHYHFGQGLVSTPSEFGNLGVEPTHPDLLDWLALQFIESGWSLKAIHRLILTSETFKQSSVPTQEGMAKDAGTRLLWRFPPRRLEAEPIRDTLLQVSGNLDARMGGPGYEVFEPNDNYVRVYKPKTSFGPEEWRRMVYQFKPRMEQDATFGVFDCPDAALPAARRTDSTTPLQALNLLNSPFILQQSNLFAERLMKEVGPNFRKQIGRAFQLAYSRDPDREELTASAEVIRQHGLPTFCRALFNTNEFLYLN